MKLIRPVTVNDDVLNSSNVAESEAVYSAGTTYALNAIVRGNTTETAHRTFQSLVGSNVGNPLTDATKWLATGSTNRWKMFDGAVQSQTENANSIAVELQATGRVDSVALFNVSGVSATVTMTDATDGVVFDETFSLVSTNGITDWFAYFFEPIERLADLYVGDMPPYANAAIDVTISDTGGTAKCGALVMGLSKQIGVTQYGASVGIIDYSRKEANAFGEFVVTERAFSKRASFTVWSENGLVDQIQQLLAAYRATPIVYVGSAMFGSTLVYGFYRDGAVEIAYPTHSILSLTIEGLT
jgi:hypothetical protein